ncbi:MAG TPA: ATP-binding protein, partial [Dyadobacter sp.]|nr:ATP-binding protein [Dyadobacter sp.]
FTYLIQNLLHNAIQHSDLSADEIKILISVELESDLLKIVVQNNFSNEINLDKLNATIAEKSLLLSNAKHIDSERTRTEDGTGYLKIDKTIRTDLLRDSYIIEIDEVKEDRIFKTTIMFGINNLQKTINEATIN